MKDTCIENLNFLHDLDRRCHFGGIHHQGEVREVKVWLECLGQTEEVPII